MLEARARVGGRVEQVELADGRRVQLGGEVVGNAHTSYLGLVEELGLTLTASYVAEPGEITRQVPDSVDVGDWPSWCTPPTERRTTRWRQPSTRCWPRIDPEDPWSCPDLSRLDRLSVGDWLREVGASPGVLRLWELVHLSLVRRLDRAAAACSRTPARSSWVAPRALRRRAVGEPPGRRGIRHGGADDG